MDNFIGKQRYLSLLDMCEGIISFEMSQITLRCLYGQICVQFKK